MGISFTEVDTSDGVTKLHFFNKKTAPDQPVVPRYTVEVSQDLLNKGIGVGLAWVISTVADFRFVRLHVDHVQTKPSDLGGYVIWYNGLKASDFDGEVFYRLQAIAGNRPENILVLSEPWYFYVDDR